MLRWNQLRQFSSRVNGQLSRLAQANQKITQRPKILKLWLLCSCLWLILVCCFTAFLYWYYDKSWLLNHKFYLLLLALAGLFLCIILPLFWRIFVVIDGQERTIRFIERTIYTRESPAQQNLIAFQNYLKQKYHLPVLNRCYILAVHGVPDAFSDVGEQLQRTGWVQVDNVYLVLINTIDDIESIPPFRGKYHCPFDGLIILRDMKSNKTSVTHDNTQIWLEKFYQVLNWKIPFVHVFQSDIELKKFPFNQIFDWSSSSEDMVSGLKNKSDDLFIQAFLKSRDRQFLSLIDAIALAKLNLAKAYSEQQLPWSMGVAVQARQSNWWETWSMVAEHLYQRPAKLSVQSGGLKLAKAGLVISAIAFVMIVYAFASNYREAQTFRSQITNLNKSSATGSPINSILALQNHIALVSNVPKPFYRRLGFNHDDLLLNKAFAAYGKAAKKWLIVPTDQQIILVLESLHQLQTLSNATNANEVIEEVAKQSSNAVALDEGFNALKAYLMLRRPKRIDNIFLSDYLSRLYRTQGFQNADTAQNIFRFYTSNMSKHRNWFLNEDSVLVGQSRVVLNHIVSQQQEDVVIYQHLLDTALEKYADIDLVRLAGKESTQFWTNKEKLRGAFTARAWKEWFKPEIDKLNPEHFKNGSWVLNESEESNENNDIRKQIMILYKQDYFNAWKDFLSGIQWVPVTGLNKQMDRLKKYSDKKNSVLVKLLTVIQMNASIGYPEDRTDNGKGVLQDFEPIVDLIKTVEEKNKRTSRKLDEYQENLLVMYLEVQKVQGASNQASASQLSFNTILNGDNGSGLAKAEESINLQVANLGEEWQDIGHTLLSYPFVDTKKAILVPALDNINALWQQMVVSQWNYRFANRYPLNPSGDLDVSLSELQKFIDPQKGVVAQFNQQYLNKILNLVGNQWIVNPAVMDQVQIDDQFVSGLNELNQLLEFVADGTNTASFEVMLLPTPEVKQIILTFNKQNIEFYNEKSFWRKVNWSVSDNADKKASIQWIDTANKTGRLEVVGDLSILRLLEKAQARKNDDGTYQLKWIIKDRAVEMNLKNLQTNDLITLLKLKGTHLPQQVFKVDQDAN
ncbi:ImcF-related family protein [Snodgrassella gandavensis]|uniref:ImcF-related family protein n=1 Tax=Snodgrassella gandavensis TaxID=2946698 RepID=UPI001EF571AC|nr:ImcF-related family protein [Snodgrassella gandavensis]